MSLGVGDHLGRYHLTGELGQGGMSVVYRARDPQLERVVAIKVMHDFLASNADARKRFHREAIAVAKLEHPNIIKVLDFPDEDVTPLYIVMEYVDGEPLSEVLASESPLGPPELSLLVGRALCDALAHAHAAGVIHRDLKPENVLVGRDGTMKLTDFGIARLADTQSMTMTGTLLGSPAFMAPEYIEGKPTDHRVDIFAFGAMLYQLTTGHLPFCGETPATLLHAIAKGEYIPAGQHNPGIHSSIGRIIDTCIAHNPEDRYGDANGVVEAMDTFLERVQLEPVSGEALRAALAAPVEYGRQLEKALGVTYIDLAKAEIQDGNHGQGLEDLDRVMSLDPDHPEVHQILAGLQRRESTQRAVRGLGVALVCGVLITIGALMLGQLEPPTPPPLATPPPTLDTPKPTSPPPSPPKTNVAFSLNGVGALSLAGKQELAEGHGRTAYSKMLEPGNYLAVYGSGDCAKETSFEVETRTNGESQEIRLETGCPPKPPTPMQPPPPKPVSSDALSTLPQPKPVTTPKRQVQFIVKKETGWVNVERDGQVLKEQAMTGFTLDLKDGRHELKFTRTNHQSLVLPVEVTPAGTQPREPIVVGLMPLKARLSWRGVPVGSEVQIYRVSDNKRIRSDILLDVENQEQIWVSIEPGKQTQRLRVKVTHNKTPLLDKTLEFKPGKEIFLPLNDDLAPSKAPNAP